MWYHASVMKQCLYTVWQKIAQVDKLEENLEEFEGKPVERRGNTAESFQMLVLLLFPLVLLDGITANPSSRFCHTAPCRSAGILIYYHVYNDGFEDLFKK